MPKDKLDVLSDMEDELRDAWLKCVKKQFKKEFGKEIDESYLDAFRKHGLWLSRSDNGELRHVQDSKYLAKIMGYDPVAVYGGDKEMTADTLKNSKSPFDLLLEVTASNVDLFCEYAIATKGVAAFTFSKGLQGKVDEFFESHPVSRACFREVSGGEICCHHQK